MFMLSRPGSFASSPFAPFGDIFSLVSRQPASSACCTPGAQATQLALDIRETPTHFVVDASLPGFRKADIDVQVHEGVLTISGSRTQTAENADETWIRRERTTSNLWRSIRLPEGITGAGISADLTDGILTVRIPKPAENQPRKIAVN
ncbi:MAG: Hsp20/alpha crystallin family protein [Phycisphaerales bacterium]